MSHWIFLDIKVLEKSVVHFFSFKIRMQNIEHKLLKMNMQHSLTTYFMNYKNTYTQTRNDVTSCLDAKQHLTASLLLVYVVWCPQTFFPSSSFECLGRSFMRMRFFFHLLKHFHFENFTSLVHIKFTSHTQFHLSYSTKIFTSPFIFIPSVIFIHVL